MSAGLAFGETSAIAPVPSTVTVEGLAPAGVGVVGVGELVVVADAGAEVEDAPGRVELHRGGQVAALGGAGVGGGVEAGGFAVGRVSKQTPRIRVVPAGQLAAWPPTVLALPALAALVALGTTPRAPTLMSAPVSEPLATLAPLTALLASLPVVTDFDFSCREPTLFLPSWRRRRRCRRQGARPGR